MDNYHELLKTLFLNNTIIKIVYGSPIDKSNEIKKIEILPFMSKEALLYQFSYVFDKKTTHKNFDFMDSIGELMLQAASYKQINLFTSDNDYQVFIKGSQAKILKKNPTKSVPEVSTHNKKKNYIIPENEPCRFLEKLGIMNSTGKVFSEKYDKFRQINKYLEIISTMKEWLQSKKHIKIVDFGSGKSYLTFALHHYLVKELGIDVHITGIDLKKDVIDNCRSIASELNLSGIEFICGNIRDYMINNSIDMVVTLHACDTATDIAIANAVKAGCGAIITVPCCQHELFTQIENKTMQPMLKYGLFKERFSSLVTDSVRAQLLEVIGYNVDVIEFIDAEHTPKNIMIKALKKNLSLNSIKYAEYLEFKKMWNINPALERELGELLK